MTTSHPCPNCGTMVPTGTEHTPCPKCLLKEGLGGTSSHSYTLSDPQISVSTLVDDLLPPTKLAPGSTFGKYRIHALLGQGGMGEVYEAEDTESGRRLALKVLSQKISSPEAHQRFIREGRTAASINHLNSVYIFGTEEIEHRPVITMEYVPGGTLKDLINKEGPVSPDKAINIILQIISGLEAAHEKGILHRDIKPANCFIEPSGLVKIGDYGLSISTLTVLNTQESSAGTFRGTPAFASPEQLRGESLDFRSDMYAVGVTFFYLLTGDLPFKESHFVRLMAKVLEERPPVASDINPRIPRQLSDIIAKCLAKTPEQRYGSYKELRDALLPLTSAYSPAPIHKRIIANIFDIVILSAALYLIGIILGQFTHKVNLSLIGQDIAISALLYIAYFTISESLFGQTLGKILLNLRVTSGELNAKCSLKQALIRSLIWYLVPATPSLLSQIIEPGTPTDNTYAFFGIVIFATLYFTMRKKNGFASLYDLASGTRVREFRALSEQARERSVIPSTEIPKSQTNKHIGPYVKIGDLSTGSGATDASLILGYDTRLFRPVWIRLNPNFDDHSTVASRQISRRSRLRWLGGKRQDSESGPWDAYEAPGGSAFLTQTKSPMTWAQTQDLINDLVDELAISAAENSLPESLSLRKLWINEDGRLKLLEFPAPGTTATKERSEEIQLRENPCRGARKLIGELAMASLHLNKSLSELGSWDPYSPIPLHASRYFSSLDKTNNLNALQQETKQLGIQEISVPPKKRLLAVLANSTLFLLVSFVLLIYGLELSRSHATNPYILPYFVSLEKISSLDANEPGPPSHRPFTTATYGKGGKEVTRMSRDAFAVYAASLKSEMDKNIAETIAISLLLAPLTKNKPNEKTIALVEHYRDPSQQEVDYAIAFLDELEEKSWLRDNTLRPRVTPSLLEFHALRKGLKAPVFHAFTSLFLYVSVLSLILIAVPCLLLNAIFNFSLSLRVAGLDLVDKKGNPAGVLRRAFRSLVIWLPVFGLVALFWSYFMHGHVYAPDNQGIPLSGAYIIVGLGFFAYAALLVNTLHKERSVFDRLSGLWVVPMSGSSDITTIKVFRNFIGTALLVSVILFLVYWMSNNEPDFVYAVDSSDETIDGEIEFDNHFLDPFVKACTLTITATSEQGVQSVTKTYPGKRAGEILNLLEQKDVGNDYIISVDGVTLLKVRLNKKDSPALEAEEVEK